MIDREVFWRSAELKIVVGAAVALVALGMASLHVVAERTDYLMIDFREWRPVPSQGSAAVDSIHRFENYFPHIQSPFVAQRPFRLTLQLEAGALPGDRVAAERTFAVDTAELRCFKVYVSPRQPIEASEPIVEALLWANGEAAAVAPVEIDRVRTLEAAAKPRSDGTVHLRLEIRARRTLGDDTLRRASKTDFEFATFERC